MFKQKKILYFITGSTLILALWTLKAYYRCSQTQNDNTATHPAISTPAPQSKPQLQTQTLSADLLLELDIAHNPSLGNPNAPVTMIVYSSYYCGFCSAFKLQIFPQIKEKYIDKGLVYYIYKDAGNPQDKVFIAPYCAHEQEQFWTYQNLIIEKSVQKEEDLLTYAQELNLDLNKFRTCLDQGQKYQALITTANQEMEKLQVEGIPFFIINNQAFSGLKSADDFFALIESELARQQTP